MNAKIIKLVLFNSRIAVKGLTVMNYYVAKCIDEGTELLPNISLRSKIDTIKIHDEQMEGKGWLIGYLTKLYMANIKSSIKNMYTSVIKQCIMGNIKVHHPFYATKNEASSLLTTNLTRCICCPVSKTAEEYAKLDGNAKELVQFHRGGFEVDDDGYIKFY